MLCCCFCVVLLIQLNPPTVFHSSCLNNLQHLGNHVWNHRCTVSEKTPWLIGRSQWDRLPLPSRIGSFIALWLGHYHVTRLSSGSIYTFTYSGYWSLLSLRGCPTIVSGVVHLFHILYCTYPKSPWFPPNYVRCKHCMRACMHDVHPSLCKGFSSWQPSWSEHASWMSAYVTCIVSIIYLLSKTWIK